MSTGSVAASKQICVTGNAIQRDKMSLPPNVEKWVLADGHPRVA